MSNADDPLTLIRDTPHAMQRASVKLIERADTCDNPLVAGELQRLASRCLRRAKELQAGEAVWSVERVTRPPRR